MSMGLGFAFVSLSSTALIGVADHDAGVASALVNTTQQVGGALGTAFLNTVAAAAATSYLVAHARTPAVVQVAAVRGYTTAFEVSALLITLAALVAATFIRTTRVDLRPDSLETLDPERCEEERLGAAFAE